MPLDLAQWLAYQERLHPAAIELGLARVREVWQRLGAPRPAPEVITVGGTNGKGSTVALLEGMLAAGGWRVGCYTSPHLLRYNERIRMLGHDADDAELIAVFARIEAARGDTALTYFEFGTLAALLLFAHAELDIAILEVGLGGRLDAVNLIDADLAIITTVDLDHQDWLGADRDAIGREKAAIGRPGRPAILGETAPPRGLLETLAVMNAASEQLGADFHIESQASGWQWRHRDGTCLQLPKLALQAPVQYANAAAAIAALYARDRHRAATGRPWLQAAAVHEALAQVQLPGRLQHLGGAPELVVDVAHNPQAACALAAWLASQPPRPVHAIYGSLADKDIGGVIEALKTQVSHWHLASLEGLSLRGLNAASLAETLLRQAPDAAYSCHATPQTALAAARRRAPAAACLLAFGSFLIASVALRERPCG